MTLTAQQFSAIYTLTSPTGFNAVFNNSAHADYVGDLLGENAITGLDSPQIRSSFYENVQADGAVAPQFFATTRPVTFNITIRGTSVGQRNARSDKLRKALADCLRADGELKWNPTGAGGVDEPQQRLKVRYSEPYRETGGWVKNGFFGMTASWPFIESASEQVSAIIETAVNTTLANDGTFPAYPHKFEVTGPGTSPRLRNTTTAQELKLLGLVVPAATTFYVNMQNRTMHYGTVPPAPGSANNLRQYLDFPGNADFWYLQPGNNTVRLDWVSGSTANSQMLVRWRDTWL